MKKLIIGVITAVILRFTIMPVSSGSFYATLSGTAAASNDSLAMVDFSIRGDTVNNVRGYINYPASQLSVFSVEKNPELSDLAINFDTDKSGSVYFAARSSSPIARETVLFTITFVVHSDDVTVDVTTSDIYANITVTESVVVNQQQIDEANEREKACQAMGGCIDEIVIPDPIYAEQPVSKEQSFTNDSLTITVSRKNLKSLYLKTADFPNAKCTPVFNKLVSAYKVEIDSRITSLDPLFIAENPDCVMEVSDEINNQIIVTLTGENGEVNSYVFTIIRTSNFDPTNNHSGDITPTSNTAIQYNTSAYLLMAALGLVSLGFMIIGGYYIWLGAREP
jgi:hypothetical protein